MYPYQLQSMAVERAKDLRKEATATARARQARGTRAGTRPASRHPTQVPGSSGGRRIRNGGRPAPAPG